MRIFGLSFVLLGAFLSFATAQTSPTDPGNHLLQVVKTLAFSERLDDPNIVGSLLKMPMVRNNHYQDLWHDACPAGEYQFSDGYTVTGNNWFHTLPTGMKNMRSFPPVVGDIAMPPSPGNPGPFPYNIIGDPDLEYHVGVETKCVGPNNGLISAEIDFKNIPSYACISITQIKSIFPKLITSYYLLPLNGSFLSYLAAGKYTQVRGLSPPIAVDKTKPFTSVDFDMTQAQGGDVAHQRICLLDIYIHAAYQFGRLHDLPGQVPYPQAETHPLSPGQ